MDKKMKKSVLIVGTVWFLAAILSVYLYDISQAESLTLTKGQAVDMLTEAMGEMSSRDLAGYLVSRADPEGTPTDQLYYNLLKQSLKLAKDSEKVREFQSLKPIAQGLILSASPGYLDGLDATLTIPAYYASDTLTFDYSETEYSQ